MAAPVNLITCLSEIVGLTPDIPSGGKSGYYLTDQKDGIPINYAGAVVDKESGVGALLAAARADAVRNFLTDLSVEFSQIYTSAIPQQNGYIGKQERTNAIQDARSRAVVQIKNCGYRAVMEISSVKLFSTLTGQTVTVEIYDALNISTALASVVVTTTANQWAEGVFTTPLLIDLSDENVSVDEPTRYFITWEIPTGDYPRGNKTWCCNRGLYPHLNYVEVNGYSVESLSEMADDPITAKRHGTVGMGLSFNAKISCDWSSTLCDYSYNVFSSDGWQWVLAKALQHGGVIGVCDKFIKSQNINQYTTLSREVVYGLRAHAQKEYLNAVKYLAQNMPGGALQCFKCRDDKYAVRSIMV